METKRFQSVEKENRKGTRKCMSRRTINSGAGRLLHYRIGNNAISQFGIQTSLLKFSAQLFPLPQDSWREDERGVEWIRCRNQSGAGAFSGDFLGKRAPSSGYL